MSRRSTIVRRKRNQTFPLDGDRRSQVHVNDPSLEENNRRLRIADPLIDGWDPGDDPFKVRRRKNDSNFPVR